MANNKFVTGVIALAGAAHLATGAWAFIAARSFYDSVATFAPYNEHFVHDLGAFVLGIGATLAGAVIWQDARFVALLGGTVAAGVHCASHVIDRHHGGVWGNPWLFGAFTLVLLVAVGLRAPSRNPAWDDDHESH